jgi:hypothetical protein
MIITGKPSEVAFYKEVNIQGKTMATFNVKLEGDDRRFSYLAKDKNNPKIVLGVEGQFELEEKSNEKGSWWTIKPHREDTFGAKKYDSGGQTIGMAMNNACQMFIHGKIDAPDKIESYAKSLLEMSIRLKELYKDRL